MAILDHKTADNTVDVQETDTLASLSPILQTYGQDCLLVLDIDEVIVQPGEPAFQKATFKKHTPIVHEAIKELTLPQQYLFGIMVLLQHPLQLTEEQIPDLLKLWRSYGSKAIALTAALNATVQGIDSGAHRAKTLRSLGVDFTCSFPEYEDSTFDDLKSAILGFPTYREGILFTNGENIKGYTGLNSKGDVLLRFLKGAAWQPRHIVFVDDKVDNVIELGRSLQQHKPEITFSGMHYIRDKVMEPHPIDPNHFANQWKGMAAQVMKMKLGRVVN